MRQTAFPPAASDRGWVNALQTVAAYLRQGYYLPDGEMYPADEQQALNTNSPV